jgi:hypothetical protein
MTNNQFRFIVNYTLNQLKDQKNRLKPQIKFDKK